MLIFTLYQLDGVDHFQVQAIDESKPDSEPIDVTTEYQVLPMQVRGDEIEEGLDGFFFGKVSPVEDDEPEEKEIEKLPHADCPNWDE